MKYTEAKLINRVKDDSKINILINYINTSQPTTADLKNKIAMLKEVSPKREHPLDIISNITHSINKKSYNKLSANKQKEFNIILKEIEVKGKKLEEIIDDLEEYNESLN